MSKKLNVSLIQMRWKTDKLDQIDRINLWGNDLEDISILRGMTNVKVVSLSLNRINTLEDFAYWQNLTELYLRKNDISDLKEINYLTHIPNLTTLWLSENPISAHQNYRQYVIKLLPNLVKLDEEEVTPEERAAAQSVDVSDSEVGMSVQSEPPHMSHPEQYKHKSEPTYESPDKPQYEQMPDPNYGNNAVHRTPPSLIPEEYKKPVYSGMPDGAPGLMKPIRQPELWNKAPVGSEMYAGTPPLNYIPPQEKPNNMYYGEAHAARYGMNDTGINQIPQPKLMHAHSTPVAATTATPNGGKYKNENTLWAVLVLLKELEENELELVRRDIDKKLNMKKMK